MEAEYIAANSMTHNAVWLQELLTQLGFPQKNPADLFVNNQSAIWLVNNPKFHQRLKHMGIKYHYIHNIIMQGDLLVHWCHTTEQTANILMKSLDSIKFWLFHQDLRMLVWGGVLESRSNPNIPECSTTACMLINTPADT